VDEPHDSEYTQGEVPHGVGPEVFRERLRDAAAQDPEHGAHVTLDDEGLYLADIESVEADDDGHRTRIRLRNGVIIAGVTGAAIVAALATIRFRRRHRE
jgi:hypothetical protein